MRLFHLSGNYMRRAVFSAVVLCSCIYADAASKNAEPTEDDIFEMSIAENVSTPVVPKKNMAAIVDKQKREAKRLKAAGIPVELTRNGEVIVATIGAEGLFLPNSTELRQSAGNFLRPFTPMLTQSGMWKVLIVMHSDDTGSEEYVNSLTEARAESVCKWFEGLSLDTSTMVPYGRGADEPLLVNNSRLNRGANRRLEVYLIPGRVMLDMAKRGMIP